MEILYHPRAMKFLRKISKREAKIIIDHIGKLNAYPHLIGLDVKKLTHTKQSYRMRVGNIRVIFEIHILDKTIYIHDIDFRGNIY